MIRLIRIFVGRFARPAVAVTAGLAASVLAMQALAHHSTNGIYDESELVELSGRVIAWRFVNPHPSLVLEVRDGDGGIKEWDVSYGGSAVTHLRRRGYTAETFQSGDQITVRGYIAVAADAQGLLLRGDPQRADGSPVVPARQ